LQSVLISGSSSGFGANVALALLAAGWRVFASMRDITKGQWLETEAVAMGAGERLSLVALDVTDTASVDCAIASVLEETGGTLDALFANAGYSTLGAFEDLSDEDCRQQMETNFFGVLALARHIVPLMRAARRGRIVVVSSNAVNTPHPLLSIYAASKWALEGWSEAMAVELAPFGVDVRVVQPGAHRTTFAQHVIPIVPEGSAYREWIDTAMPGTADLDRWGNDAEGATGPIVKAIVEDDAPFHTRIGEDAQAFYALKGIVPFEVRAWLAQSIAGLPAPSAYSNSVRSATQHPVMEQVVRRIAEQTVKQVPQAADIAARLITAGAGR